MIVARHGPSARSVVEALLPAALRLRRLSELSSFLESVARHFGAQGAILWRQGEAKSLQILSQYPVTERRPQRLPIEDSLTRSAILRFESFKTDDVRKGQWFPFLDDLRAMCTVPFRYEDGALGALNLYRTSDEPFSETEFDEVKAVGPLMPSAYQTALERQSFAIVADANRILGRQAGDTGSEEEPDNRWPREGVTVLSDLCQSLAGHLDCLDVCLFLNHSEAPPDVYLEVAGTLSSRSHRQRASPDEGLMGWVLANQRDILVEDLSTFEEERERYEKQYPGIVWRSSDRIVEGPHRVVSYMAVPIVGKRLYGVIRCSVVLSHPFCFSPHDPAVLGIVASQIARFWSGWLDQGVWLAVVRNVSELNRDIEKQLSSGNYNLDRIHQETLKRISIALPEASILDVRMSNAETRSLEFVAVRGSAWSEGSVALQKKRRTKRFSLDRDSAGAHVMRTGESWYVEVAGKGADHYDETFAQTRQLYTIPIRSGERVIGVLDARSTDQPFPSHARAALFLFARQLGLYHYLVSALSDLKSAEIRQKEMTREREQFRTRQSQVYKDLQHQLRGPIWVAHRRTAELIRRSGGDDHVPAPLVSVRGLCARAEKVAYNMRLFVDLAEERGIAMTLTRFTVQELIEMLEEMAADQQVVSVPEWQLKFRVLSQSFRTTITSIQMDGGLFAQALGNILDNAAKYSYVNTVVRIEAGFTHKARQFYVSVQNVGIPIKAHEIQKVLERGYQTEAAWAVSGLGSGIGLWITDHVMRAHGGYAEVRPTNPNNGITDIRLIFGDRHVEKRSGL